jgi:hypothetical protein
MEVTTVEREVAEAIEATEKATDVREAFVAAQRVWSEFDFYASGLQQTLDSLTRFEHPSIAEGVGVRERAARLRDELSTLRDELEENFADCIIGSEREMDEDDPGLWNLIVDLDDPFFADKFIDVKVPADVETR